MTVTRSAVPEPDEPSSSTRTAVMLAVLAAVVLLFSRQRRAF